MPRQAMRGEGYRVFTVQKKKNIHQHFSLCTIHTGRMSMTFGDVITTANALIDCILAEIVRGTRKQDTTENS